MLSDFYRSGKWRELTNILRLQRTDKNGNIICCYCKKPIVKAYDCIAHHTVYLTEENYTNAEISLNPDLIQLVHHKCHNKIHNKLIYPQKQVFLVYGSPCSGKSTWVSENMNQGDLVVDIDNIWQCLSFCERYVKPNRLKSCVFAVRDLLIDNIRMRSGKWLNAYIIGGYPLISERERLLKSLGARPVFIDTPKDECLKRLQNDSKRNPEEWAEYISEWFERFSEK